MQSDLNRKALEIHKKYRGKITTNLAFKIKNKKDLALIYTPGVGEVAKFLSKNKKQTSAYTWKGRCIAVVSDGSAVLGLGNIGPEGAYPVMEGKCALFKRFANLDAVPILLNTQNPDEIISTIKFISSSFGAINLEDISAPRCFYIERKLQEILDIPIIHDDQWGTAVVVYAGLINACKVTNKKITDIKVVINGAGAAGTAIVKMLHYNKIKNIISCDSQGTICKTRVNITPEKKIIASMTNPSNIDGDLKFAAEKADVLIGVSKPGLFTKEMIKSMNEKPIIFALANPVPEILPHEAKAAGAYVVATGRSDFPNQVNNALGFPGIFKGLLQSNIIKIELNMLTNAAIALANVIKEPNRNNIIPSVFNPAVVEAISKNIK